MKTQHIIPIKKELNELSNLELLKLFDKESEPSQIPFFAIFAKRIHQEHFKSIIFNDVIADKNTVVRTRVFKPSFMILLSALDYCEDESVLSELTQHIIKHWTKSDLESFVQIIKSDERFFKYFKYTER